MNNVTNTVYLINCRNITHSVPIYGYVNVVYSAVAVNLALIFPILILNFLVTWIIYRTSTLHNPSNVLLAFQAIFDILVSVFGIPEWTTILLLATMEKHNCILFLTTIFTSHVSAFLSFVFVSCITLDRYIAIFKPFFYNNRISTNISIYFKCITGLCIIVISTTALSFLTIDKGLNEMISLIALPLLINFNFYAHFKIYYHVKNVRLVISRSSRINATSDISIAAENKNVSAENDVQCSTNVARTTPPKHSLRMLNKKQTNITILTFMLLLSLTACYTSYFVIVIWWTIDERMKYDSLLNVLYMWSYTIICFKSLLNPIIVLYQSRVLRGHIVNVISRK